MKGASLNLIWRGLIESRAHAINAERKIAARRLSDISLIEFPVSRDNTNLSRFIVKFHSLINKVLFVFYERHFIIHIIS